MIFDRTIDDVNSAKAIRKRGMPFSEADIQVLERGTLTINTLNRIEAKQEELKNILNGIGYFNAPIINKEWSAEDIFNESEFQRIVDNNVLLRDAFYVYKETPKNAVALYRYDEINALEKILFDLEEMADYVKTRYRRCGIFNCGG